MDKLPEDFIFDIFARLPVKFILRCKSVCKSWRSHILNSYFVELHMVRTLTNPGNHSFIVHDDCYPEHVLRLINTNFLDIANNFKLPPKLNKPNAGSDGLTIVGSCNGLLGLAYKRNRQRLKRRLYLWNPATRQLKDITNYSLIIDDHNHRWHNVSFGFGFDFSSSDYKVVRIVTNNRSFVNRVQVYALNRSKVSWKNAWKEINVDLKFRVHKYVSLYISPTIVKGSPYWIIEQNPVDQQLAMVSFDMHSEKFSTISLPDGIGHKLPPNFNIFEFKESVAVAVAARPLGQDISIWTLDDDSCWIKKFTITNPRVRSILGCLETGEFVGSILCKLVLYDSVNELVKPTQLSIARPRIYNFSESLVNLNEPSRS